MSDEEIYFDNDDDDQENDEDAQEAYEEDVLDTPEKMFESAIDSLGIDDYYSIDLLYKVYVDERTTDDMKIESLKNIAKSISQYSEDIERINNVLSDVIFAYKDGLFNLKDLNQTVAIMIANLSSTRDALSQFLDSLEKQLEEQEIIKANPTLYAEAKLRKLELLVLNGQGTQIEQEIKQIEPLIDYSPDTDSYFLRSTYFRLLILKIIIAEEHNDENQVMSLYEEAKKVNQYSLSTYQKAVFSKLDGIYYKRNRNFNEAKNKFFDAFKFYDDIGNQKRIYCIKYCVLCEMANHDFSTIFNSSLVVPYKNDASLYPLYDLSQAYLNNDIAQFVKLIEPTSKLFNNESDLQLLDEIRKFVLRGAIWKFTKNYKNFEIKYAAKVFNSDIQEVKQLIMDLILTKDLNALLNPENDVITVIEIFRLPKHLICTNQVLSEFESRLIKFSSENKIDY